MTVCLEDSFHRLFDYVKRNNYEGIDLFDGLNSLIFKKSIFYKSRICRLAITQFCKKSPINCRGLFIVPKGFNPKGGALFLMGNLNMFKTTKDSTYKKEAEKLYKRLKTFVIKRKKGIAWGYNFDWQARAFFVPTGTPNTVTSVYVGQALIDFYETFNDKEALDLAIKISEFLLNEMIMKEDETNLCFNYIPQENAEVHNASLLAASYILTINKYINSDEIKEKALKALHFSISDIQEDGSWPYGKKPFHRWVDNFHTAFNIESLLNIKDFIEYPNLKEITEKVINYYLKNLFTPEGLPKYLNNKLYPIDIHVIAETIIAIEKIKNSELTFDAEKLGIIENSTLNLIEEFQDKKGYFYYQKHKNFWNKIPYIRWAQAWMFYALSLITPDKNI